MTLDTFVNISGNLRDAYKSAVPGTLRHVDQLMNERRTNPLTLDGDLRTQWFYTADGEIYSMDGKTPTLAITREANNLVLRHIDDAFTQLTTTGNYRPDVQEVQAAIHSADTLVVDLTTLKLQGKEDEYRYMPVSTSKYDRLTSEQRALAERVYGQGADFVANMQMLKDAKIDETRIFVLSPDYVREHAGRVPLARASWLLNFYGNDSGFLADVRYVNDDFRVRGVRRESVAAGDAPEKSEVPVAPSDVKLATFDDVRAYATRFVPEVAREQFELGLRNLYKP